MERGGSAEPQKGERYTILRAAMNAGHVTVNVRISGLHTRVSGGLSEHVL